MYSSAYVWAKVLSHMEERLGAVTVSAWFDDAEVVELNETIVPKARYAETTLRDGDQVEIVCFMGGG